jgi:hypothetical protein
MKNNLYQQKLENSVLDAAACITDSPNEVT